MKQMLQQTFLVFCFTLLQRLFYRSAFAENFARKWARHMLIIFAFRLSYV